jgi:hypothetical protein
MLDRHPLAGDGPGILQAGITDIHSPDVECIGQVVDGLHCAEAGLFDQEVGVIALAAETVERQFLDLEIDVVGFDHTRCALEIAEHAR